MTLVYCISDGFIYEVKETSTKPLMFSIHVDSFYILVGPKWRSNEIQWQIMQKAKREQILFKRTMCGLQPLDVASISQMFKAYLEDKFYSSLLYQLTAKSC